MSTRAKIILGLVAIILIANIILGFFTSVYVNKVLVQEVQTRVSYDLNSAVDIYDDITNRIDRTLRLITIHNTYTSLDKEVTTDLEEAYSNQYTKSRVDILIFTDMHGDVIYRANNPDVKGDNMLSNPIIKKTLKDWTASNGTIILNDSALKKEGDALVKRSFIKVIKTTNSNNTVKTAEKRGMFISYAIPIRSILDNKKLGVLYGAYLLNNSTEIVDLIKTRVFQNQKYDGKDIGTVTLFFDDVRVSTNVKLKDTIRAVGSRMSNEVYESVIKKGEIWADRAFVVNDWFITAYKPIKDPDGKIIGAIYIGLLEKPFQYPQKIILLFFIIALSITALFSVLVIYFYTKMMMRPIERVIKISKRIMGGDLSARTIMRPKGELGVLCKTIDQMAESMEEQVSKIQEDSRMQIMQSEKLASVGRLAAGVAHEINNPLTGVLTFAHFLKEKKTNDESDQHDIDVIIQETTRVRDIIRGLLDFARQSPPVKAMTNVNETIQQLLMLIKGQKEFRSISIKEEYGEKLPQILADKNQLQQVFLNLILNAGEAITGQGSITINTSVKSKHILISIKDTGCGISEEDMYKIFDPFFTTKPVGKGTGLGLSVSYGIIQQHGGEIKCESKQNEGTTFNIYLPWNPNKS
jgi:two-component system, NtrC family, sensor kinase